MDDRDQLIEEAQILNELEDRTRSFPLYFYQPNEKVIPFHADLRRIRILSGGNRSGKTEANVAESGSYALGYRPWVLREMGLDPPERPWLRPDNLPEPAICFNGLGIRVPIPNQIFMVTGQSMKKGVGETLYPKLKKLLGPFIADEHMAHSGVPADIILKNGSKIVFGSAEQGAQSFESTNYTFNAIDEPVPRRVYTGIARGAIDQYAPIVLTFTPIGPWSGWIFKDLYVPGLKPNNPGVGVYTMSIYDNRFLPREAVDAFASDPAISEMEKEARLYGRFMHLTDRIYQEFSEEHHVIPSFYIPRDWFCGMVIDPHTVKPWFIAYFAIDPRGICYFFKEWPPGDFSKTRKDTRSIEEYALLIRQLDGDLPIQLRIIDPNYGPRRDMVRGVHIPSIVDDIARYGLHFQHKLNDDIAYGESKVRELLHYDTRQPIGSTNHPRLFITEDCPNIVQSLSLYSSRPRTGVTLDGDLDEQRRDETYKDPADVVRYVSVSGILEFGAEAQFTTEFGTELDSSDLGTTGYGEHL